MEKEQGNKKLFWMHTARQVLGLLIDHDEIKKAQTDKWKLHARLGEKGQKICEEGVAQEEQRPD